LSVLRRTGVRALAALAAGAATMGFVASAGASAPGGMGAPGTIAVAGVTCVARCVDTHTATPGATVRVRGLAMDQVATVVFRGGSGPIQVSPLRRSEIAATARVPKGAISGRPYVRDSTGRSSSRSPNKLHILPPSAIPPAVFPVRGPHEYWGGFGAGRGHQGVDIGAACGTPLVAALAGKVSRRAYQAAAGNYVVIDVEGINVDIVYMHLVRRASVSPGQTVSAGQVVGYVGETGRASGCHLHFEYWIGPWWRGGSPVDPMPYLREWDRGGQSRTTRDRAPLARGRR
jgi:murein DD-endopeptidase MepM/ murein hydrolase activator NlpD